MISAKFIYFELLLFLLLEEICGSNPPPKCGNFGYFECKSSQICIPSSFVCDGIPDCEDKSDEIENCYFRPCVSDEFKCAYGKCVKKSDVCNGVKDCLDGSDESACTSNCKLPKHHDHGRWEALNQSPQWKPDESVPEGTILTNKCDEGYESENENIHSFCLNGKWTKSFACSRRCPTIKLTNVDQVNCTFNDKPWDCSRPIDGTILKFRCSSFHENLGSSNLRLCKNGTWDYSSPICVPECGKKKVNTETLAVGSQIATKGNYPWQVALFKNNTPQCGGSLIATNIVLTVAHCVVTENMDGTVLFDANVYEVAAGQYYRSYKDPRDAATAQYSKVSKIVPAEQYRGRFNSYIGDIALLITENKFLLSVAVQLVCLDNSALYQLENGQFGVVTGWGLLQENSAPPDEMRELKVPYTDDTECRKKLPYEYVHQFYSYDKLCAGYFNKSKAVCKGDSGNPLVFDHNGRYYVHGVVSLAPQHDGGCDSNQYTLFTNIQKYIDLIEKTILKYSI